MRRPVRRRAGATTLLACSVVLLLALGATYVSSKAESEGKLETNSAAEKPSEPPRPLGFEGIAKELCSVVTLAQKSGGFDCSVLPVTVL